MKTEEGNKLIAEFMGLNTRFITYPNPQLNRWEVDRFQQYWCSMEYHSSWDWLMPVVEKIEKLGHTVRIIGNTVLIYSGKYDNVETEGVSKIDATYSQVVEFIKWYNRNLKA